MAGLQAGQRVRPPGAVARHHPGRPHPPRLPRRLRRRLLEPPVPPRRLPLRHGRPHRPPPRPPRLRLRRHPPRRLLRRPRPGLQGVPPRRLLLLAPGPRRLRRQLGPDPDLPQHRRRVRQAGPALPYPRPVLPGRSIPTPVGMLQAPHGVWLRLREPDAVDKPGEPGGGRGLLRLEQRPDAAVLQLHLLQGRAAGQPEVGVEEGQRRAHHRRRRPHLRLRHRVQRLQERPDRGPLPPLQTGLCVEFSPYYLFSF